MFVVRTFAKCTVNTCRFAMVDMWCSSMGVGIRSSIMDGSYSDGLRFEIRSSLRVFARCLIMWLLGAVVGFAFFVDI